MAHANKRISIVLAIVAFLFILTIILLIIPYEGSSHYDPANADSQEGKKDIQSSTTTEKVFSLTSSPTMTTKSSTTSSPTTSSTTALQDKDNTTSEATTHIHPTTDTNTKMSSTKSLESDQDNGIITTYSSVESTSGTTEKSTIMSSTYSSDSNQGTEITTTNSYVKSDQPTDVTTTKSSVESDQPNDTTTTDSSVESTSVKASDITTTHSSVESDQPTDFTTTISSVESGQPTDFTTTDSSVESTSVSIEKPELISEMFNASISKTAESKQLAARMSHLMNHFADPCQDFYEYSCGNGVDNPYLSPVNPKDAVMNRIKEAVLSSPMENPAHVLYESCLDKISPSKEKRIDYIRNLVMEQGEIDPRPDLPTDIASSYDYIDDKPLNLTTLLATMMKHHFTPFFDLTIDVDDAKASQFVLKLTPPLFHSPLTGNIIQYTCLKSYYQKMDKISTPDLDELYEEYKNCSTVSGSGINAFTKSTLKSIQKLKLLENVTEEFVDKIEQGIEFAVAEKYAEVILQLFPEPSDLRRSLINRDYTLYTLQEMDDGEGDFKLQLQNFSWHGLVEELLDRKVDPVTTSVQVYFPDVISKIFLDWLDWYLGNDIQNFRNVLLVMWSQYLDSSILEPVGHTPHTEEYCLHLVTELLPDVTTQLYLSSFDQDTLKSQMTKIKDIAKSIKSALKSQFNTKSSHLTEEKIQKIDSMKFDVGQELFDDYLASNNIYPKETLDKTDFPSNVIQLLKRSRRILYSFLDQNPNTTSIMWQHSNLPYSTAGSTIYPLNTVLIPIGSFESLFYEHGVPDIINYAGLGMILSHEMMHAFDSIGVKFEFSSISDASNMVTSSENCQKKQLENIHKLKINDILVDVTIPTDLVVNEALSDSSSVLLAWRAYLASNKAKISETEQMASEGARRNDTVTQLSKVHEDNTVYYVENLPMMDTDALKQFYIRSAQIHCEKTSQVNIMNLKENEHLPGSLRVNHMAKNDPLFKQAFGCENDSPMIEDPQCSYLPLNYP